MLAEPRVIIGLIPPIPYLDTAVLIISADAPTAVPTSGPKAIPEKIIGRFSKVILTLPPRTSKFKYSLQINARITDMAVSNADKHSTLTLPYSLIFSVLSFYRFNTECVMINTEGGIEHVRPCKYISQI